MWGGFGVKGGGRRRRNRKWLEVMGDGRGVGGHRALCGGYGAMLCGCGAVKAQYGVVPGRLWGNREVDMGHLCGVGGQLWGTGGQLWGARNCLQ